MSDAKLGICEAEHFLKSRFGDVGEVAILRGGEWSTAFGFVAELQDLVVRFGKYAVDYHKDLMASSWAAPGLPIPEVVEIGTAFNGSFAVSKRLFGEKLDQRRSANGAELQFESCLDHGVLSMCTVLRVRSGH